MEKEYSFEIMVTHKVKVWAENEEEAKDKAQSCVFEENVNYDRGDLITGYRCVKLK